MKMFPNLNSLLELTTLIAALASGGGSARQKFHIRDFVMIKRHYKNLQNTYPNQVFIGANKIIFSGFQKYFSA